MISTKELDKIRFDIIKILIKRVKTERRQLRSEETKALINQVLENAANFRALKTDKEKHDIEQEMITEVLMNIQFHIDDMNTSESLH